MIGIFASQAQAQQGNRHVVIMHCTKLVLHLRQFTGEGMAGGRKDVLKDFERVAQSLGGDTQIVQPAHFIRCIHTG